VYPDLPGAASWGEVWATLGKGEPWPAHWQPGELVAPGSGSLVRTVACQLRSERDFRDAVRQAAGRGGDGAQAPRALLVLGGGHPVRKVSSGLARSVFLPAERGMTIAREMRESGE